MNLSKKKLYGFMLVVMILFTAASYTSPVCAKPKPPQLSAEYDRFKNKTFVKAPELTFGYDYSTQSTLKLQAYYIYDGQQQTTPDTIRLLFLSDSSDWLFLRNSTLALIIDGKLQQYEKTSSQEEVYTGRAVGEYIYYDISLADYMTLAYAQTVEGRIGGVRYFVLKDKGLEVLILLAKSIPLYPPEEENIELR